MQPISFPGWSTAQHDDEHDLPPEPASRSRPLVHARDATSTTRPGFSTDLSARNPALENTAGTNARSSAMPEVHFVDDPYRPTPLMPRGWRNCGPGLTALM